MRYQGTPTDYDRSQYVNQECEYPLAGPSYQCETFECRCRKGKRLWHQRAEIEAQKRTPQAIYDEQIRRWELQRYSRTELGPVQLKAEMNYILRQIEFCQTFPPSDYRNEQILVYGKQYRDCADKLRRESEITTKPDFDERIDWSLIKNVNIQEFASRILGQAGWPSGEIVYFLCPFHDEDRPSLATYPPGRGWYCFGCGKGGQDAASLVAEVQKISQVAGYYVVLEMCDIPEITAFMRGEDPCPSTNTDTRSEIGASLLESKARATGSYRQEGEDTTQTPIT